MGPQEEHAQWQGEVHRQFGPTAKMHANFPLPSELRDKILGFALSHEEVHAEPYSKRPKSGRGETSTKNHRELSASHTYAYPLTVILVNKQIYAEAFAMLKEKNNFVVISHKFPHLARMKHLTSLPIVTENESHVNKFLKNGLHTMHISIDSDECNYHIFDRSMADDDWNHQFHGRSQIYESIRPDSYSKPGAFIILAEELPAFCNMMQNMFYITPAQTDFDQTLMQNPPEKLPWMTPGKSEGRRGYTRTKVELNPSVILQRHLPGIVDSLLRPLERMIHGKQEVKFTGFPQNYSSHLQELQHLMGPQSVDPRAIIWHVLETLRADIDKARLYIEAGNLPMAESALRCMELMSTKSSRPLPLSAAAPYLQTREIHAAALIYCALMDASIMRAIINIKLHKMAWADDDERSERQSELCRNLRDLFHAIPPIRTIWLAVTFPDVQTPFAGPETRIAKWRGQWILTIMDVLYKVPCPLDDEEETIGAQIASLECAKMMLPEDESTRQDLTFMESICKNETFRERVQTGGYFNADAWKHLGLYQCAFPETTSFPPTLIKPPHLHGFSDGGDEEEGS